jgi:hypothetical protein
MRKFAATQILPMELSRVAWVVDPNGRVEGLSMRRSACQLFMRFLLVLAFGAGFFALAAGPERPKAASAAKPSPIILATVIESDPPDHCLLPPRDRSDESPIGRQADNRGKKKIIACG